MLNKLKTLLIVLCTGLLLFIVYLSYSNSNIYENKYIFYKNDLTNSNVKKKDIDLINDENFLLSFETIENKKIKSENISIDANIKYTNHEYLYIMNYKLLSGSFITKNNVDEQSNILVLNHYLAFKLFGGIDCIGNEIEIDNIIYTVIGCIDDKADKGLNAYAVLKDYENKLTYIAEKDEQNKVNEQILIDELKQIGIETESKTYSLINLNLIDNYLNNKTLILVNLYLITFLLLILYISIKELNKNIILLKQLYINDYINKLITKNKNFICKLIITIIVVCLNARAIIYLVANSIKLFILNNLNINNKIKSLEQFKLDTFNELLISLNSYYELVNILFVIQLAFLLIIIVLFLINGIKKQA